MICTAQVPNQQGWHSDCGEPVYGRWAISCGDVHTHVCLCKAHTELARLTWARHAPIPRDLKMALTKAPRSGV